MSETAKPEPVDVTKLPKLYFNMYIAGIIRNRADFEAINCDLLYFTLLMKMNQYAKEVYFARKAKTGDAKAIFDHLEILRKFVLAFYEISAPRWELIQNELEDPLEKLDELKLEEDPFGDASTLGKMASKLSSPPPPTPGAKDPSSSFSDTDEVASSLEDLTLDDLDGLGVPSLSRQASIRPKRAHPDSV
jgi:hypothetical protein